MDIDLLDNNGNRIDRPTGGVPNVPAPPSFDANAAVNDVFKNYTFKPGETDVANLAAKDPRDRDQFLRDLAAQADRRNASTNNRQHDSQSPEGNALYGSGTGNATNTPGGPMATAGAGAGARAFAPQNNPRAGLNMPGLQFDDPYTNLYEQTARNQLNWLQGNPELERLMGLLTKQIEELGSNPGYSPQEMALLNTQSFEPIEKLRGQSQRNVMQRASARGVLPSSGIVEDEAQEMDRVYDQMRTVANRDLSINALNRRRGDQQQAINLAEMGLNIPNQLGQQQIGIANQLYQLPRNAMMDSLAVLNASSPQAGIGSLIQLLGLQQQQSRYDQQADAQFWQNIGLSLPDILDSMGL